MVKGSALYMVIVVALFIGVICSSLIAAAFYYKIDYLKKSRYDDLGNNLASGVNILLATPDSAYSKGRTFSLFDTAADSVYLQKKAWGVFTLGIVKAFIQHDTLFKSFTLANSIDSSKWAALYLVDNDRPFAVSGKTLIRGNTFIPKAGVQEVYVNGFAYQGDKRLIIGTKHNSEKSLPALDTARLRQATMFLSKPPAGDSTMNEQDSLSASFLRPPKIINFKKEAVTLSHRYFKGNIIIYADTTIAIDSTTTLNHVLIFGKSIIVKSGFQGNGQLFARDSIYVGARSTFNYPSCLAVVRMDTSKQACQEKITLGEGSSFSGLVFTYERHESTAHPMIIAGKKTTIRGQLYTQGNLQINNGVTIDGSIFTGGFYYRNSFTSFQNYVINTTIDAKALSPYYLSSSILPVASNKKKILEWLESN